MAEHYGIDFKIEDPAYEAFINRMLVPSLSMLGKKMGWDLSVTIAGDVMSIEAKRG